MITTVIIDAIKRDRDTVTSLLSAEDDIKMLAYGNDGYDALKLIGALKPDIALVNIHLDYIEGDEISPLLRARSPSTAVIVLVSKISDLQLYKAVSNKVSGFVNKETDMDMLPKVLKYVSEGGCFISPSLAARVLCLLAKEEKLSGKAQAHRIPAKGFRLNRARMDPTDYLSKTELRIISCIGEGYTSEEIASDLGLVVGTVRNNISSIMHKTGLHNRSKIAYYAINYGLVPPSFPAPAGLLEDILQQ